MVDDRAVSRRAVGQVVLAADGFELAGEADSGEHALAQLPRLRVDLVLMDVHMPGMGGLAAAREIAARFPDVRVILVSVRQEYELAVSAASVGARFCTKEALGPDVLEDMWGPGR